MGLFDWFKKKSHRGDGAPAAEAAPPFDIYSGMRVEVTGSDGGLLFVAKLVNLQGNRAELYQYSETDLSQETDPIRVNIRGYHDYEKKAVYMEGLISPLPRRTWQVEELLVSKMENDRAFFRLNTDIAASAAAFGRTGAAEQPCRVLNISVGGAYIGSEYPYQKGDTFLLKVRLLEDREPSAIRCQVLRIIQRKESKFEYGCKFLGLNEADQTRISQNIFAAQRKRRSVS